ncbi:hypothetical protein ACFYO2_37715 [Streptomyces sp. NPDC006602]|uniref:hypothetical protein n=1 Tax=Streptomyces sp. NPDC006602 TaxID=3364751 RepID=UPI00369391AC
MDTEIVAIAGSPARPAYRVVRLPDGTLAQTAQLDSSQRAAVGQALAAGVREALPGGGHRVVTPLLAEIEVGTTRHRTVRFVASARTWAPPSRGRPGEQGGTAAPSEPGCYRLHSQCAGLQPVV